MSGGATEYCPECHVACRPQQVQKEGENQGKWFVSCPNKDYPHRKKLFKWVAPPKQQYHPAPQYEQPYYEEAPMEFYAQSRPQAPPASSLPKVSPWFNKQQPEVIYAQPEPSTDLRQLTDLRFNELRQEINEVKFQLNKTEEIISELKEGIGATNVYLKEIIEKNIKVQK